MTLSVPVRFSLAAAALLLAAPAPPAIRLGGERNVVPYADPFAGEKGRLVARINEERLRAGVRPVAYSTRAAAAGDLYCRDAAARGSLGHWDLDGRSPYLRWALAGGVDAHAENFASKSRSPGPLTEPVADLLLEAHEAFMAERPPLDGHRRSVLDPAWTHVGIGAALSGKEFRMTEEFVAQELDWVELPGCPLAAGSAPFFAAKLRRGWNLLSIGVAFEPAPQPISRAEAARRGKYELPRPYRSIRPWAPPGEEWADGVKGTFRAPPEGGEFRVNVPLDRGPGSYWVMVFAGPGEVTGRSLAPVTLARIEAE